MKSRRCSGSASKLLMIGLAFFAAGVLILGLAPFRSLTCAHSGPPPIAACAAIEPIDGSDEQVAPDCIFSPDIQCRIEANVLGFIPSHEQSVASVREFELRERRVDATHENGSKSGLDFSLLFVTADGPKDLGWHAKSFATRDGYKKLTAFARNPYAAPLAISDNRVFPLVIGFVVMILGLMSISSGIAGRG